MPQGLQAWNVSGQMIVDLTDRITRVLGETTIAPGTTGYITDWRFAWGTIWWQVIRDGSTFAGYTPTMTADPANNRIAYSPHAAAKNGNVKVIYGVF